MAPFDREGALKRAEKALRLGRVDSAIEEYQAIVLAQPRDWNSANALGDLFVRAGQLDKGVEQYTRIADHLADEGFHPKAAALFKKIVKVKPLDEYAQIRAGDVAAKQGLLADAKAAYHAVAERRRKMGNPRGAAEMAVRLGMVDPDDFVARFGAAKAARDLGDTDIAVREFRATAEWFATEGRAEEAGEAYRELLELDPNDNHARGEVLKADIAAGDLTRAIAWASSPDELRQLAAALEGAGQVTEALGVLGRLVDLDASDVDGRIKLVRAHLANGDMGSARQYLTPDVVSHDPSLWMVVAESELRQGHLDEGRTAVSNAIVADPSQREAAVVMACRLAEHDADAAYPAIEAVADAAVAEGDFAAAAAALHEFATRVRRHIVALMRLVEICVDGGLEATMYSAQAQLADAYLDAGRGLEARIISEDLVAREPWDTSNIARFRSALEMLGEADPDAIIAERLSGESPFMATDKMDLNEGISFDEPADAPDETVAPAPVEIEVDLTDALSAFADDKPVKATKVRKPGKPADAGRPQDEALSAEQLRLGLTYRDMGMMDDAIHSLELAARSPRQRFEAASTLGRLLSERRDRTGALAWFERAAEVPAPSVEAGRALLYDLGNVLEDLGESARALAVFGELAADARGYRDVAARVARLSRVQVRG